MSTAQRLVIVQLTAQCSYLFYQDRSTGALLKRNAPVEYANRSDIADLKLEVLQFLRDLLQLVIQRVTFILRLLILALENSVLALETVGRSAELAEPVRKWTLASCSPYASSNARTMFLLIL